MTSLDPSMRLKVKGDVFYVPDANGGVYFRNNEGSFRMEGGSIHLWIEKLLPVFTGEHTLADLTDGLPDAYRDRVYEIAEVLYRNGMVRDVGKDLPHCLTAPILKRYESQIEFIDYFVGSGAFRFQSYRESKVLAVGSGWSVVSLVSALLESGLPKIHVLLTEANPVHLRRLTELAESALLADPDVVLEEITLRSDGEGAWREALRPFEWVLYVSESGDIEELRALQSVCRAEKKVFLPAVFVQSVGFVGPLVRPDSDLCWESAWRRLHQAALCKDPQWNTFSDTAAAMLSNVMVFALFKSVTGIVTSELQNQLFLLNLETFEGSWHSFAHHPVVVGNASVTWIEDIEQTLQHRLGQSGEDKSVLLSFFAQLTSPETGIFHHWDEGDLKQLPLSLCRVSVADPLSDGPAQLLPEMICAGLTHEKARLEAGFAGIEAYVSRLLSWNYPSLFSTQDEAGRQVSDGEEDDRRLKPGQFVGVGVGETFAEAVCRGLQKCLEKEFSKQHLNQHPPTVAPVQVSGVQDEDCQYCVKALTTLNGPPEIAMGEEICGFPVIWVRSNGHWYGSVGLNVTLALRMALQHAILASQIQAGDLATRVVEAPFALVQGDVRQCLVVQECPREAQAQVLHSALQVLKRNRKRMSVMQLHMDEALSSEELAGVFGVVLREEELS
ncbi:putative thiazole-containing bacteriocin maturation protein [Collibacillus ludicampi]|uniref:Thiazole-containing bacteriocin maturation protein n=1 Tax=Collibacillus ludicampi TaxID=2771369 RepID=A0AAV4LIM9_9BACL|nr:putative thiazole-containing bacteriocin maturation protein [Collibacillus ludicampi]GIM47696.1 putative thiazole-containing bacteriocin maturation protein [Collibacillus ludicampi]